MKKEKEIEGQASTSYVMSP